MAGCLTCSAERPDGESGATMVTRIATSMAWHVCKHACARGHARTQANLLQLERRGIAAGVTRMHLHCVRNDDGRAGMLLQANPGDLDDLVIERLQPRAVLRALCLTSFERGSKYSRERMTLSQLPSFSSAQCSVGGRTPTMPRMTRAMVNCSVPRARVPFLISSSTRSCVRRRTFFLMQRVNA